MGTSFEDEAFAELMEWMKESRKTANRIYDLIKDIMRIDKNIKSLHLRIIITDGGF